MIVSTGWSSGIFLKIRPREKPFLPYSTPFHTFFIVLLLYEFYDVFLFAGCVVLFIFFYSSEAIANGPSFVEIFSLSIADNNKLVYSFLLSGANLRFVSVRF